MLETFTRFHVGFASKYETSSLLLTQNCLSNQAQSFRSEGAISWFQEIFPTTDLMKPLAATELPPNTRLFLTQHFTQQKTELYGTVWTSLNQSISLYLVTDWHLSPYEAS